MVIIKKNRFMSPDQLASGIESTRCLGDNGRLAGHTKENFPRINVYEEEGYWVYTFEVPGVDPRNIDLTLRNTVMTVRGKRSSYYGSDSRIHRRESCVGECDFVRTLNLPDSADAETIRAKLENGLLIVTMDKTANSHEKKINIKHEMENQGHA
ncbi:MAG: Hsp20/alpha crystallin family protein [Planctomycetota bacterium]|jgi:HSP20 family protein